MLISDFVELVRDDFKNLAELASPETALIVERVGAAIEPALQKHLLEVIEDLVQEFNLQDGAPLNVHLEGEGIRLSRLIPVSPSDAPPTSDYSARIALRLSDDLKENIEHLATDVGSSVNSWIVRTLERSVRIDPSSSSVVGKHQLRGKGRA
jgi:hypothetical protein